MPWPHMVESSITFASGSFVGFAFEAQRIADAVARDAGGETALLGAIDGGGDVDAQAEVGFFHRGDEIFGGGAVVEDGGDGGGGVEALG